MSHMIKIYPFAFVAFFRKCLFEGFSGGSFGLTQNGNLSQGTETLLPIMASPMLRDLIILSAGWINTSPGDQHPPSQRSQWLGEDNFIGIFSITLLLPFQLPASLIK